MVDGISTCRPNGLFSSADINFWHLTMKRNLVIYRDYLLDQSFGRRVIPAANVLNTL